MMWSSVGGGYWVTQMEHRNSTSSGWSQRIIVSVISRDSTLFSQSQTRGYLIKDKFHILTLPSEKWVDFGSHKNGTRQKTLSALGSLAPLSETEGKGTPRRNSGRLSRSIKIRSAHVSNERSNREGGIGWLLLLVEKWSILTLQYLLYRVVHQIEKRISSDFRQSHHKLQSPANIRRS